MVGSVLLEQIASQAPRLLRDFRLDLRVRALMTSKKMLLSDQSIGLDGWKDKLAAGAAGRPGRASRTTCTPTTCRTR